MRLIFGLIIFAWGIACATSAGATDGDQMVLAMVGGAAISAGAILIASWFGALDREGDA